MKINKTLTALIAGASLGMSGQVFAAGTTAGTPIQNDVTLNYTVSGVTQDDLTATETFKVDNRVDMTLESQTSLAVYPGESVDRDYVFKNTSNNDQFFTLGLINHTTTGDTEDFTIPTVTYAIKIDVAGTSSIVGAAFDVLSIPEDGEITYTATFTFPLTHNASTDNQIKNNHTFNLLATAAVVKDALKGTLTDNTLDNKNTVANIDLELNVFNDAASEGTDAVGGKVADGTITEATLLTVSTADLTDSTGTTGPTLTVQVLHDPLCNSTWTYSLGVIATCDVAAYLPKAIPGATVEYTLTTKNSHATIAADAVEFDHTLPADQQTLGNVKVLLEAADITTDSNVNNSSTTALDILVPSIAGLETVVITFTALIK